jgi:hypothetical protein
MTNIYFDIESIPAQASWVREEIAASITAPGQYKKPDSIAEWLKENRDSATEAQWLETSFDGGLGQIVVIGWAIDDEPAQSMRVKDLSLVAEADLLCDWFAALRSMHATSGMRPVLVGHNHCSFDIPFIWKRAVVHGIKPPLWFPRDPKPWSDTVADTMTLWSGAKGRVSMERLCRILGIEGKGGMSGADVWPMVKEGRIDEVAAYCKADVERTRRIYQRLMFAQAAA